MTRFWTFGALALSLALLSGSAKASKGGSSGGRGGGSFAASGRGSSSSGSGNRGSSPSVSRGSPSTSGKPGPSQTNRTPNTRGTTPTTQRATPTKSPMPSVHPTPRPAPVAPSPSARATPRIPVHTTIIPNAPLVWSQSKGTLTQNGKVIATGYAGFKGGKNNPDLQGLENVGPIPTGRYSIGTFTNFKGMPYSMPLNRVGPNPTGRSGFWIHGGQPTGNSSRGCIVLPSPQVRAGIALSGARELIVVP